MLLRRTISNRRQPNHALSNPRRGESRPSHSIWSRWSSRVEIVDICFPDLLSLILFPLGQGPLTPPQEDHSSSVATMQMLGPSSAFPIQGPMRSFPLSGDAVRANQACVKSLRAPGQALHSISFARYLQAKPSQARHRHHHHHHHHRILPMAAPLLGGAGPTCKTRPIRGASGACRASCS